MLLGRADSAFAEQVFDLHHNGPDHVHIHRICGYATLEGFLYDGAASCAVAAQERLQVALEKLFLDHSQVSNRSQIAISLPILTRSVFSGSPSVNVGNIQRAVLGIGSGIQKSLVKIGKLENIGRGFRR
jgi:hypothetical protein